MKIVFTSYSSSPEFVDPRAWLKRIEAYTGVLESLGKQHEVTGIERINFSGKIRQGGVNYIFIRQTKKIVHFPFRIHQQIKKLQPDVVVIHGFIFPLQLLQLKWMLGKKIKIIVWHQAEKPFKGIKKWLQQKAAARVDAFFFASLEFQDDWSRDTKIIDAKKIHELFPGSSIFKQGDRVKARNLLAIQGSPVFLWVGRLDANKDPVTVVKAFMNFLLTEPDACLYLIYHTDEYLKQLLNRVGNNELARSAIRFVGTIPHDQLEPWFNSADFFIAASHYEGAGTAVTEAMSCGCIPILSNIASFRKITGPANCGLLFEPGKPDDLLKVLLSTRSLNIDEERKKTLLQFTNELSFDAIAGKIQKVIKSI